MNFQIKEIEETIEWNVDRESELKEVFFRILQDRIRHLVASEMVLQIFNYVEFAYEQIIAPNETRLSSLDMALALETEYDNLMMDLSVFDLDLIKSIEKEVYEKGETDIKQAREANKMLTNIDKMSKRLKSSYEPSRRQIKY